MSINYILINNDTEYQIGDGTGGGISGTLSPNTNLIIENAYNNLPVTTISDYAFQNIQNLDTIYIPKNITNIHNQQLCVNSSLIKFIVDNENNNYYSDDNGILYDKNINKLYIYPPNCELSIYHIPNTITIISNLAFNACNNLTEIYFSKPVIFENNMYGFLICYNLKKIILPEGQEKLPYYFLSLCSSIKNIIIPASVNKLCLYAFVQTGLINITFNGAPPTIINIDNSEYNGSDPIFSDNLSLKNIYYYYQYKNEWTNNLFWIPIDVKLLMIQNISNILMIRKNNYPLTA